MEIKTVITIKTDTRVKQKAQKIAKEMGIPLGTFLNAQLRQLIRERSITVSLTPTMSKALERTVAIVEEDIGESWFCTEAEARKAGYVKSKTCK